MKNLRCNGAPCHCVMNIYVPTPHVYVFRGQLYVCTIITWHAVAGHRVCSLPYSIWQSEVWSSIQVPESSGYMHKGQVHVHSYYVNANWINLIELTLQFLIIKSGNQSITSSIWEASIHEWWSLDFDLVIIFLYILAACNVSIDSRQNWNRK